MNKIRTLIVDDELLAREGIRILLKAEEKFEIVEECANGKEALRAIQEHDPQLIFLDVQMPEMTGLEMLGKMNRQMFPVIVFVTAYDNYALQAFDAQAIDYLLKPFSDERFYQALNYAKKQLINRSARASNKRLRQLWADRKKSTSYTEPLVVKSGGSVIFLDPEKIDWIEAMDYYVTIHSGDKKYLLRDTLKELVIKLDETRFVRIHRSSIVNVRQILELRPHSFGNYTVVLKNGIKLPLSRRRRDALKSILDLYLPR